MSLDSIINETRDILATVPGVANAYAYIRFIKEDADFKATFFDQASGRVNAWMVTREISDSKEMDIHADEDTHTIVVRGYLGLKDSDETEEIFQQLVEAIRLTFRANRDLNKMATWQHGMSARAVTHVMFRNVLCHYCELVMQVEEYPLVY